VFGQQAVDQGAVTEVALDEHISRVTAQAYQVLQIARIGEFVKVDDGFVAGAEPVLNEITADEADLEEIFSMMPPDMDGDTSIKINGGVAFPALFNSKGPELMREIKDKSTGPMGPTGYASIVVGDLMLGREKSKPYFMQVSLILNEMTQKLLKNA
jgi:hypothetical protein